MAKATIIGNTVAIVSSAKLEDIQMLEKYSPKSLVLKEKDEDGKSHEVFRIGSGSGAGAISKYGVNFGAATNAEGFGVVTVQLPDGVDDPKEFVADKYGVALVNLNKVEEAIPAAIEFCEADREAIMENITVA